MRNPRSPAAAIEPTRHRRDFSNQPRFLLLAGFAVAIGGLSTLGERQFVYQVMTRALIAIRAAQSIGAVALQARRERFLRRRAKRASGNVQ